MTTSDLATERFASAKDAAVIDDPLLQDGKIAIEAIAKNGNKTVNPSRNFADIRAEYLELMRTATIRPEYLGSPVIKYSVRWYAATIVANRQSYAQIEAATRVPWFVIGILHALECSFSFDKHLFNGDPLSDYTKRYPPGYPKDKGPPPFSFNDSAISALDYDELSQQSDWSLARTLFRLESYNGMSYRSKMSMASPYLWSFTTHYLIGKYKEVQLPDGTYKSVYDPKLQSKQCGAAAMLKELISSGQVSFPDA